MRTLFMYPLLTFWYKDSPAWFYSSYLQTIHTLEGHFAVRDTLRNLNKPIFQDYTLQGRFIGLLLRLARIGLALFLYFLVAIIYGIGFLIWLCFPFICILNIIGAFFGI